MTARHTESVTAGGTRVDLSNMSKVLFPGDDITKGDLVEYYRDVAARMLPYLRERPIVMARYPDGSTGQRVFQKNVPGYFPGWVAAASGPYHHRAPPPGPARRRGEFPGRGGLR